MQDSEVFLCGILLDLNGNNEINYLYNASGSKLRKETRSDFILESSMDYLGTFIYEDDILKYMLTEEGRVMVNTNRTYDYQYFLKDLPVATGIGNTRVTFTSAGTVIQEDAYYPFGILERSGNPAMAGQMEGLSHQNGINNPNQYIYNSKELQEDYGLEWYDYGARFYDVELGRWHVVDPLAEKTYSWTPFRYGFNNSIRFIDPDGKTEEERKKFLAHQKKFVEKNPGNSYGWDEENPIPKPGDKKIDCSGQQRSSIKHVTGKDSYRGVPHQRSDGTWKNGVEIIADKYPSVDLNDAQPGNMIVFENTDGTDDYGHMGAIKTIEFDDKGNVSNLIMIDSGGDPDTGTSGPRETTVIEDGKNKHWGSKITSVLKWDTFEGGTIEGTVVTATRSNSKYLTPLQAQEIKLK